MSLEEAIVEVKNSIDRLIEITEVAIQKTNGEETPKRRGRPPNPTPTTAAPPSSGPKPITVEMARAAANKVADEKGRHVAQQLIAQHGAKKVADMDASKYTSFLAACDVVLSERQTDDPDEGDDL